MSRNYDDTSFKIHGKDGNKIITEQSQNVDHAINGAKAIKDIHGGKTEFGYHAAKIPMVLLLKWGVEDCGDQLAYLQGRHHKDPELAKKLAIRLNSNEFKQFRIWDGELASSDMLKEGNKCIT